MSAIGYNARMIRSLVFALAVTALPVAALADLPRPMTATTGAAVSTTTSGAAAVASTPSSAMRPGVAPPPKSKHPYFFAAYAAVWAGLFAYVLWLGSRISSLEERGSSKGD